MTVLDALNQQHKVRLNGIDAPETGQAFSQVAKSNLSLLVFGQDVLVVWAKVDRYGRLVGTVTLGVSERQPGATQSRACLVLPRLCG